MKKISLKVSKKEDSHIFVGNKIFNKVNDLIDLNNYSKICLVTDSNIKKYWFKQLRRELNPDCVILLKPGENHKNIDTLMEIWNQFLKNKCDKSTLVVLCGGGVVGDMGSFAAATFLRGIDFIQVPTTLLAQVDSSIGGKTGINYGGGKNIVGAFSQPKAVIIDVQFLSTLPEKEYISGFAEMIKHGLIRDQKYFKRLASKPPLRFSIQEIESLITKSCQIKTSILKDDIFQQGSRKLVLFGHTVGQSIESLGLDINKPMLHGEAISIGLVAEVYLSHLTYGVSYSEVESIRNVLEGMGLPTSTNFLAKDIKRKMLLDKKISSGILKWTLITSVGLGIYDVSVDEKNLDEALSYICNK